MEHFLNSSAGKEFFSLPTGWKTLVAEDKALVPGVTDPVKEINRALDHPIGSSPIEELAKPGMEVVLLFDDLQRPTPADLALPEIMDRLNRSGIPDGRITAICGLATHPILNLDQLRIKVGDRAFNRLSGRLFSMIPIQRIMSLSGRPTGGPWWKSIPGWPLPI